MKIILNKTIFNLSIFCILATVAHAAPELPKYDEVYNLLRAHLSTNATTNLDQATVKGLLQQLKSQVALVDPVTTNTSPVAALGPFAVYDNSYAVFQFTKIEGDVAAKFTAAYQQLTQTNKAKIKGVVLDLRFATGTDYAAAAAVADCFFDSTQPLLDWGAGSSHATAKTNAISVPVTVLLNEQTSGSAEALAAILRDTSTSLLIGRASAGRASVFTEYPLSNGEKLSIATAQVKSANGKPLTGPLQPDIGVPTPLADEKAWLTNEYKDLHPSAPAVSDTYTNSVAATNRPASRRYNEATLLRARKEGFDPDDDEDLPLPKKAKEEPMLPVVADPALARALDLLKGLAVVQRAGK